MSSPKRRNVKSPSKPTTDQHERDKDFLTAAEMDRLLVGAKGGRHGIRNYLLMMMYRHGIVENAAESAGLDPVHPHMLRNSCGFYLADQGYDLRLIQDYLGHHTRIAGSRFVGLWTTS